MATLYDLDILQKENKKLKDLLLRVAELYIEEEYDDDRLLNFLKAEGIIKQLPSTLYGVYTVNMEFFNGQS